MNLYEIIYLISPELTNEDANQLNEKIAESLKALGATLYKIESPKKRNLAYQVNGFNEAYLASIDLDASAKKTKSIEEKLKEEEKVIRQIIISKDALEKEEKEPDVKELSQEKEEEKDKNQEEKKNKKGPKEKKVKLKEIDEKIDEIL